MFGNGQVDMVLVQNIVRLQLHLILVAYSRLDLVQMEITLLRPVLALHMLQHIHGAIQQDLEMGRLSAGHARALLSLSEQSEQLRLRGRLLLNNWSVRETEKQVKLVLEVQESRVLQPSEKIGIDDDLNTELRSIEAELQRHLGTKMRIDHKPPYQGEIRLSYFSAEELDRLLALLRSAR